MSWRIAVLCLTFVSLLAPPAGARSQAEPSSEATSAEAPAVLDRIRTDLAALEFEKALNAIEAFLASPALTEAERLDGLILRAEAHVSYGDLDAAESDYREILALRPAYEPDTSLTPPKAMARFEKVRDELVGSVLLTVEPPDARILADGREVTPAPDGVLRLLVGNRTLLIERAGFDPGTVPVTVEAGKMTSLQVQLVPNARTVIVRTEPDGVEVRLDGVPMGSTTRPESPSAGGPLPFAELTIEHVALGDHTIELVRPCFRTVRFEDMLTVDMIDHSPREYDPVEMAPVRSTLVILGGPDKAELRVDGEIAGRLPVEPLALCPGDRRIEVRAGDRTVWWSRENLPSDGERSLSIRPRPNAVLVGSDAWPGELREFGSSLSTRSVLPLPANTDLTTPEGWESVELPPDTDLAVAVLPPDPGGAPGAWLLYSPLFGRVERIEEADVFDRSPQWSVPAAGFHMADSDVGGGARVVEVGAGGPGAKAGLQPGVRIATVDGKPVASAAEVTRLIQTRRAGAVLELQVEPAVNEEGTVRVTTVSSPRLFPPEDRSGAAGFLLAAWATVEGATGSPDSASALANLALLLSDRGRHGASAATWRKVRWSGRRGVGEGTAAYFLARALEAMGRESEALEAYRRAAGSGSTAFTDDGPAVAPAAADHMADLGVAAGTGPTAR